MCNNKNIFLFLIALLISNAMDAADQLARQGKLVRYGEMHVAIGQQQHQGRVSLRELSQRQHFYAVGALAGLNGEVTILDSHVVITGVGEKGQSVPLQVTANSQATLLVGAEVAACTKHPVDTDVSPTGFDKAIETAAVQAGLDVNQPFMFMIEGEFQNVRLHVIHGACPVHARIHNVELPADQRPCEREFDRIQGTVVGVYAKDAVGKLTHPATSTHAHLLYRDETTGEELTGHLERVGVVKNALLKLPQR